MSRPWSAWMDEFSAASDQIRPELLFSSDRVKKKAERKGAPRLARGRGYRVQDGLL